MHSWLVTKQLGKRDMVRSRAAAAGLYSRRKVSDRSEDRKPNLLCIVCKLWILSLNHASANQEHIMYHFIVILLPYKTHYT